LLRRGDEDPRAYLTDIRADIEALDI